MQKFQFKDEMISSNIPDGLITFPTAQLSLKKSLVELSGSDLSNCSFLASLTDKEVSQYFQCLFTVFARLLEKEEKKKKKKGWGGGGEEFYLLEIPKKAINNAMLFWNEFS